MWRITQFNGPHGRILFQGISYSRWLLMADNTVSGFTFNCVHDRLKVRQTWPLRFVEPWQGRQNPLPVSLPSCIMNLLNWYSCGSFVLDRNRLKAVFLISTSALPQLLVAASDDARWSDSVVVSMLCSATCFQGFDSAQFTAGFFLGLGLG